MAKTIADSTLIDAWADTGAVTEPDLSKIDEGWVLAEQPPHEYMNWLQNTFGTKLNQLLSRGAPDWNAETSWPVAALVNRNGRVWFAINANANSEPSDVNTDWKAIDQSSSHLYDNTISGLLAINVKAALDELKELVDDAATAVGTSYDNSVDGLGDGDLQTAVSQVVSGEEFQVMPIGVPFPLWDNLAGITVPDNSGSAKYIKLTAGLTGVGDYNDGLLTSESVTGTAPLVEATAEIAVGSLAGQVVHLMNTEESVIRARGVSGQLQFDQMQKITGSASSTSTLGFVRDAAMVSGAFVLGGNNLINQINAEAGIGRALLMDSAGSPDSRTSSTTGGETRAKNVSATYYMRIV